jgi:hypothetical protein
MADPVKCPPGTWTEIAHLGFEQVMLQWGSGALRIEMASTPPADSNTSAGILVRADDLRTAPWGLWPLRTGVAANLAYARPADDTTTITVSRVF